jgi:hypothetical protein
LNNQEWVPVPGYGERYLINKKGELFRKESLNNLGRRISSKLLKPYVYPGLGYWVYSISYEGKNYCIYMHRLLAEAFIPKIPGKYCVNHKDCNRRNNSLENLEWVTHQENIKHAYDNGKIKNLGGEGDKCGASKLNSEQVKEIKILLKAGEKKGDIAKKFNVSKQNILSISNGYTWRSVTIESI